MADPQRTEQPSQRRLDDSRKKGDFPQSKEFIAAVQFLGFLALLGSFGGAWFFQSLQLTRGLLARAFVPGFGIAGSNHAPTQELSVYALLALVHTYLVPQLIPLMMGGAALVLLVVLTQLGVTNFGIAANKIAPDLSRLNFFSRLSSLPTQNLPMLGQALVLIPVITMVVYYEVSENLQQILSLAGMNPRAGILRIAETYKTLLWRIGALFLLVGAVDLVMQRRRFMNKLKMTKQELREEAKEAQGNPQMKARIRGIQRDMARKQMMKDVQKATAVIVNPTHFAVAIRYSASSGAAPKVVAKGKDLLALRIRKLALEHQVPIVENPPLARALYKSAQVGQEIPVELYRAVAEILAYIYRLMGGRIPG